MADIDSKIDEILKPLVEALRSWVDGELDGTSFYGDAIKAIDEDTSTVKSAIKNLLLEAQIKELERFLDIEITHSGSPALFNPDGLPISTPQTKEVTKLLRTYFQDRIAELQKELG